MKKICSRCKIEKPLEDFHKNKSRKDGFNHRCKDCVKLRADSIRDDLRAYAKKYRQSNKEKIAEYSRKNKDKLNEYRREYRKSNLEKVKEYQREYRKKHKCEINGKINKRVSERRIKDPLFKLTLNLKSLIRSSFKAKRLTKDSKTISLLGCSFEEFQNHLGVKPEGNIHLDHICPCSQAQSEEELIKLQNYINFRWLSAEENLEKSDKPTQEAIDMCLKLLNREWIYKQ